ncbi:MAG TPA: small multi-drug export protein [Phycisphaerales bacterium]|nr:small multi-drug export protein [Phycisphaerales bacterium]
MSQSALNRTSTELAHAEHQHAERLRREQPTLWIATLIGPPAATLAILGFLWAFVGAAYVRKLVLTAVATFFFLGRFVILGGEKAGGEDPADFFTAWELFAMVVWMDVMTAIMLAFHLGWLFKIPWLGPRVLALSEDGQFLLKSHPWIRRATFIGLISFVAIPLAATGAIGGAIFGRLLGLPRFMTFLGIMLGSILGCALMFAGAGFINRYLPRDNPMYFYGGLAVVAGIVLILNLRYNRAKKRARDLEPPE